jgi:hypothetical protein
LNFSALLISSTTSFSSMATCSVCIGCRLVYRSRPVPRYRHRLALVRDDHSFEAWCSTVAPVHPGLWFRSPASSSGSANPMT